MIDDANIKNLSLKTLKNHQHDHDHYHDQYHP